MRMVLTGCASGIGRHLTGALARDGHRLIATDLDGAALTAAAANEGWSAERVRCQKLDVRSEAEWEAVMSAAESDLGGLDVLFNIAGFLSAAYVTDFTQRDLDLHFDVNAKGTMLGTRAAARRMVGNPKMRPGSAWKLTASTALTTPAREQRDAPLARGTLKVLLSSTTSTVGRSPMVATLPAHRHADSGRCPRLGPAILA